MATRRFADLSSYRRNLNDAQGTANVLDSLIQGIQGGIQLQQLPQKMEANQLAQQLQNAINAQKLQDLQNPQAALARKLEEELTLKAALNPDLGITRADPGLIGQTIANPQAVPFTAAGLNEALTVNPVTPIPSAAPALPETPISAFGIQTGLNINPNIPNQAEEDKLERDIKKAMAGRRGSSNLEFRDLGNAIVGLDPITGKEISRIAKNVNEKIQNTARGLYVYNPAEPDKGRYVEGSAPTPKSTDLTAAQRITAQREIRSTYDELPAKIDYFGKGQIPGSNQLKTRLDAVLKPVNGDFSKLNPQAKQTFVFAINKLRDPTSATLLAEASQIADRAGIGPRFNALIANWKEGDPLPDQVAKDIYDVISQVADVHRENLITELIEAKKDADELGIELTRIGVPKAIQDEVYRRVENPLQAAPAGPVVQKSNQLSSAQNFNSEASARAAGFKNGDMVIINGQPGHLE